MKFTEQEFTFDISNLNVAVGIPCYRGVIPVETALELAKVLKRANFCAITQKGSSIVSHARDRVVHRFLNETDADKLVFIDDDIVWKAEDMERLLCWSTVYDFVCATYPIRKLPLKVYCEFDADNPQWTPEGLLEIRAAGLGFAVIDRKVFEKMAPTKPTYPWEGETIRSFFSIGVREGKMTGEDVGFMRDWQDLGGKVYLDPVIKLKHIGDYSYEIDMMKVFKGEL